MAIFDPALFDPNIFGTSESTSTTESSVNEKKRSRGRTRGFIGFDVKKFRKLFNSYEASASSSVVCFKPAPTRHLLETKSIQLDDVDAEALIAEAKRSLLSAASKTMDIKTVKKTIQTVSMKPKRVRVSGTRQELLTQARELIAAAKELMEKKSLYPGNEPALYGDVPVYFYGEVEFRIDKPSHDEPDECDDYNGQVFSYGPDGLEDGAPNPPLHPNCRCKLVETKTGAKMWFPGSEWEGF